jgi:hypothetical protein
MLTVNIFDNTCQHHLREDGYWTSTANRKPKAISFVQRSYDYDGITLFTDDFILSEEVDKVKSTLKIAWCLESPAVKPFLHNNIEKVAHKFDYILTYREDLIALNPKKYIPNSPGGTYISDKDISLTHTKAKNCSMILSGKMDLEGHRLRHIIQSNSRGIDFFGGGSARGVLGDKADAMREYMFHLTIENTRAYHYFSEKLIDSLLMRCIPIYWGCLNIGDYFNIDGFVVFDTLQDLSKIKLSNQFYESKKDAIEENYELAKKYISSDDYLVTKLMKLL